MEESYGLESYELCYFCRKPFLNAEEWENRHSDADGEDVHAECCSVCHDDMEKGVADGTGE